MKKDYNIRDYGACGNNKNLDSTAIQKAVDDCSGNGGGTVYCPAGTYLIGTIEIKGNVNLYLDRGAIMLGSGRRRDYKIAPDGNSYLVYAENAENIRLSGQGFIDGNCGAFFYTESGGHPPEESNWDVRASHYPRPEWRPRALVHFLFCRNVTVENISLLNSTCYTLWLLASDNIDISGVKIFCDPRGPNTDGIDIDCCRNTLINNCRIETGDDAIAVKSDSGRIGIERDCENLVVTNCTLASTCSGIRLGYEGDGAIRNCRFNNIIIKKNWLGIDLLVVRHYDGENFFIKHGSQIENINFSDLRIESVRPVHMWVGDDPQISGGIRKVNFADISILAESGIGIFGAENNHIEDISFNNLEIDFKGEMDGAFAKIPYPTSCWGQTRKQRGLPYGLFGRYTNILNFNDIRFRWNNASGSWLNPVKFDHVTNASIRNFKVSGNNEKIVETVSSDNINLNN